MATGGNRSKVRIQPVEEVVEAIYDVPLSGDWLRLQESLCTFWSHYDTVPDAARDAMVEQLERHLDRMVVFLERGPHSDTPWRDQLHRLPLAAMLFTRDGSLVDANEGAVRALALEPGGRGGKLDETARRRLRDGVAQLSSDDRQVTLVELDAGAGQPLRLMLSWFRQQEPVPLGPERLVLAVAVGQRADAGHDEALQQIYGLTGAEARLALVLARGRTLDQAAEELGVKKNTARTHLAKSFAKLGVNSQHELVAVVLNTSFAIAHARPRDDRPPPLTPYLQPDLHGFAQFRRLTLADGRVLGYFEYGVPDGPAVLYLHGTIDAGLLQLRASRQAAASGLRVLCVERGGVGESQPHEDSHPNRYAEDLLELVNAEQLLRCVVVARSMGSWDAMAFASRFPERVQGVVLASGRLPVSDEASHERNQPFYRSLYRAVWESPAVGRLMLQGMRLQLLMTGPDRFVAPGATPAEQRLADDPGYRRHMRALWLRSSLRGTRPLENLLRLYREPLPDPPWARFAKPAVLVHGSEDGHAHLDGLLDATAGFQQRQVVEVPGVGHRLVHLHFDRVLDAARGLWAGG
ncbi:MAG: alpha/beta fold hydrolase [Pseudomonadales bacterium]